MDYLEKEFGIKEDKNCYSLIFNDKNKNEYTIKGKILNFNCNQIVIKTDNGLYIIERNNILELMPIKDIKPKISRELRQYNRAVTYTQGDRFIINGIECEVVDIV